MFKNYIKTAFRSLSRNSNYTIINIAGLAVGIGVCMIIFIVISYHTSFDHFHTKKDRIYRVLTEYHHTGDANISYGKDVPFPLPEALKKKFSQIEEMAPIFASHDDQLLVPAAGDKERRIFKEPTGVFFTNASFFKIFDFPLLAGSYETLRDPNNVLLTKEIAEKYFGNWKAALGQTIELETGGYLFEHGKDKLKVSGILADIPANTDFQMKIVVSYGTGFTGSLIAKNTNWEDRTNTGFGCFIMLQPGVSTNHFNGQLLAYTTKVQSPENKDNYRIQPLEAVHYDAQAGNYSNKTISPEMLNVLWLIAGFILLIACVNFINLSTAQAVTRAKEVGVRKVMGGNSAQLRTQFIVEAFLIVSIAVVLAIITVALALPYLNRFLPISVSSGVLSNKTILLFPVAITFIVTALAGFYPSIVLSRFNPIHALKSKLITNTTKGISLRRGLVVLQFVIAQALIIGTLVIAKQMNYFMARPLGFDKDAIINVPFRVDSLRISRLNYLRDQLLQVKGVTAVSFSSATPVEEANNTWSTFKFDNAIKETGFKIITKFADTGYIPTYKLHLVAGRNLQPSNLTREFLVNELLVKKLGFKNPEDILGKEISIWNGVIKCPVVGVLQDFNNRSFRYETAPELIATNVTMYSVAGIKLETGNIAATLAPVKAIWEQTFPGFVYEYKFLDDKIGGFYKQEMQLSQFYKIFSALAIFLGCLGLYGLASFMTAQRRKEVGIRKVLGASAGSIIYLFSKEFILLVIAAFAIAAPLAWYYMHHWLQDYAYRVEISWWLFLLGGAAVTFIAMGTLGFQAIKAARANPVKSLRTE
ncbi:ABC transporter permease [Niabella yanshanensis]|uniref:ABC transporter permease n=1 Tax=Niabella yanshanensis TaxID=577386 RepID=A0ABZ0W4Y5_9BACT|nr:ABC transporter permease [Niabella yanshanensis]WQD38287.1 ABC transporter permease [Niabella yanshanensis]